MSLLVSHEPELDKILSDILDEINNYCATPVHLMSDIKRQEVCDKFCTNWYKVLGFDDRMNPPKHLEHVPIRGDINEVESSRFYSYCSNLREIVWTAREYFKTDAYADIKKTAEREKQYKNQILTEATKRLEQNFYDGNVQSKAQLEAKRIEMGKARKHKEVEILTKMIELC
jgi:hypothetical protein